MDFLVDAEDMAKLGMTMMKLSFNPHDQYASCGTPSIPDRT